MNTAGELPVLYSFRRCPYAMRARMALVYSHITVELREVVLREMPAHLTQLSPKGTVPVLLLTDGTVIDESRDIMVWALSCADPDGWLRSAGGTPERLIEWNDGEFKQALDRYKYAVRYPDNPPSYYRALGEPFLQELEGRLQRHACLLDATPRIADVAIFPFIRQFASVDPGWFAGAGYPCLRAWLDRWLQDRLFRTVMYKYPQWRPGDAVTRFPPAPMESGDG